MNYTYVHIAQRDSGDKSRNTAVIIGFHYARRAGAICYYTVTLYAWMTRAMQAEMEELGFPEWEQGTPCYTPHALLKLLPPTTLIMTPCACLYTLPDIPALDPSHCTCILLEVFYSMPPTSGECSPVDIEVQHISEESNEKGGKEV